MPRYFFQILDGELIPDLEGTELPDLATARHVAVDIAAERLKGSREEFWGGKHWRLEIADKVGTVLATFTMMAEITTTSEVDMRCNCSTPVSN